MKRLSVGYYSEQKSMEHVDADLYDPCGDRCLIWFFRIEIVQEKC